MTMLPAGDQDWVPPHPGHQQAASSVLFTTSSKHCLVLLRMGEILIRNMLSWLELSSTSSWSPADSIVGALYHMLWTQSSAPEDGRHYRPKHVELIEVINKVIIVASSWLFILLYQWRTVKKNQILWCCVAKVKQLNYMTQESTETHSQHRKFNITCWEEFQLSRKYRIE